MSSLQLLFGSLLLFQPSCQEQGPNKASIQPSVQEQVSPEAPSQASTQDPGNTQDWPQFLGPQRLSQATPRDLDLDWSDADPEVLWAAPIGEGYGGPAVKGGEVFMLDRDGEVGDVLKVFDLETGETLWSSAYEADGKLNFSGS